MSNRKNTTWDIGLEEIVMTTNRASEEARRIANHDMKQAALIHRDAVALACCARLEMGFARLAWLGLNHVLRQPNGSITAMLLEPADDSARFSAIVIDAGTADLMEEYITRYRPVLGGSAYLLPDDAGKAIRPTVLDRRITALMARFGLKGITASELRFILAEETLGHQSETSSAANYRNPRFSKLLH